MIYTLHVSVHNFAVLLDYSDLSEANQSSVYISQLSQRKRPKKLSKEEKDILSIVTKYFKSLKEHLERAFVEQEMRELAFYDINEKIDKAMNDEYKMTVIIEPRSEFIKEFEAKIFAINADENLDKFARLDIFKDTIKQISKFSINVSKKDADELNLIAVRALKEVYYLPFGDTAYNEKFGLKKDMDFNALNEAFD